MIQNPKARRASCQKINVLLDEMVENPLAFTSEKLDELLKEDSGLVYQDIRKYVCRIFDINESILLEESDANNRFNKKSQKKRVNNFYKKFKAV